MRWTPIVGQLEPSPNSPLTKSGFIDSVWTGDCRICRHGDGARFPDAHGWLFRGDCQRAGHRVAVFGFDVAARFPAAGEPGEGSRSLVVVEDARAASP